MSSTIDTSKVPTDGTGVIQLDPWLEPHREVLKHRYQVVETWAKTINESEGGLDKFSKGYETFGLHAQPNGEITYREWAPNAVEASLVGEFNNWDANANPMTKNDFGVWDVTVPAKDGAPAIPHDSKIKAGFIINP
ncbi:hypothetical protein N7457_004066 [Penicillium paradoxum]|uniref:uncharacterized protein n=1 Tax=Penicillium paradoxum TaxID=176176 RepID=UPI0025466F33|nr:uncharacterized protein N7457_004066 [Penicillium paradoxum]KAJ5782292.1 hypothetical protein N7457_004066 [Penicillium paradoxum]